MEVSAVIVDLDGTVYRGEQVLPEAAAAIERLREAGLRVLFVSNNPTEPPAQYVRKLGRMGIDVDAEDVLTSGVVTTAFLRERHERADLFVVGTDGLREQFLDAGLSVVDDARPADVLVGSWDPTFDYDAMAAVLDGFDASDPFVGTDPDRTFPDEDGRSCPGSGAILAALAGVLGREPDAVLGKPSREAVDAVVGRLAVPPGECLVVGDRLDTDVAMGTRAGMRTALVTSGVTDRETAVSSERPDFVVDGLGDVPDLL
jgi:4-nitrophenyl phosphatase